MGFFDRFKKKDTAAPAVPVPAAPAAQSAAAPAPAGMPLTPEETQNIAVLSQNRVAEFKQNNVRGAAADALGKSKNPQAATALINAAKTDPAWNVRGRALTALAAMSAAGDGSPAVNPAIFIEALKDNESYPVRCAADALGKLKVKDAVEPLIGIIRSYREGTDFSSADSAIKALGAIGEDAVPALINEVKTNEAQRGYMLRALAATGSPSAFQALQIGMTDTSLPPYEHEYMAKGLAKIGTPEAIEVLKKSLDTASDEGVVKTIAKCLEDLHVETDDVEAKKKAAEIKSAKALLQGLKDIRPGMTEDEADDLVGPGVFQMGANVVHNTRFGSFQLLVVGDKVTGKLQTENVIANIEKWLKEQEG